MSHKIRRGTYQTDVPLTFNFQQAFETVVSINITNETNFLDFHGHAAANYPLITKFNQTDRLVVQGISELKDLK
ncbi:hypothetical protein TNCV_4976191 [Trichonephila clavipes]|nr:hypothetical protein TNCV_4976191 [Trichonephila clavipes]